MVEAGGQETQDLTAGLTWKHGECPGQDCWPGGLQESVEGRPGVLMAQGSWPSPSYLWGPKPRFHRPTLTFFMIKRIDDTIPGQVLALTSEEGET